MTPPRALGALILPLLLCTLLACSRGAEPAGNPAPTGVTIAPLASSTPLPQAAIPTPTPSTAVTAPLSSTPVVTPTLPPPTATAVPPTLPPQPTAPPPTPTSPPPAAPTTAAPAATPQASPAAALQFSSQTIEQGSVVFVYLNEPAASATVRFGGLQYPMANDGRRWWAIIGVGAYAETGAAPVTVSYMPPGQQQALSVTQSLTITRKSYPVEYITLDPQTASLLAPETVQNELAQRASIYAGYTLQRFWSGTFRAPAAGPISGIYGEGRSYNGGPVSDYHRGTDFAGPEGTPIYAAAGGRIAFVGELKIRGGSVIIDHGMGVFTAYHHLSRLDVQSGQMVAQGQQIGLMGATGLVTGPHLHWEVIVRGIEVDGQQWLQGRGIDP